MCAQVLILHFCIFEYVFLSVARFCHSPQEPFFVRGQGPKHGCMQSDERQPQPDGGTDQRQSYDQKTEKDKKNTRASRNNDVKRNKVGAIGSASIKNTSTSTHPILEELESCTS